MITIRIYRRPERGSIHMEMTGHAGTAPRGEDLVCGAATMMAYTAAQSIRFLYDSGNLKCKPKIQIREGSAKIAATPTEEGYAQVLNAFWVVQCGCFVLATNYPQCVRLECM